MESLRIPFKNAQSEFIEKRSRFIGHILKIATAKEAADEVAKIKKTHYDASHNVFAYILRDGSMRCSDDGEPQGTAGMPVLEVLRREGMSDTLCVVTRYFGGILLGAGGLLRAYVSAASLALDQAGIAVLRRHRVFCVTCSYHHFQVLQNLLSNFDCMVGDVTYEADITFFVSVLTDKATELQKLIQNATSGQGKCVDRGENYIAERIK